MLKKINVLYMSIKCIKFVSTMIKTNTMKTAILYTAIIITVLIAMSSCGSTKYVNCDAYKTQYKPLKAEKHKHHIKCDAYN